MPIPSSALTGGVPTLTTVPPAPREPSPVARRLVYGYQGSQFVMLLVGVIFLVIGLAFTGVFCWSLPIDLAIEATGKAYSGVVTKAEPNYHAEVNGEHPIEVSYTYSFDGAQFEGSSSMLGQEYLQLQPGSTIDLEVADARPQWSRVKGGTYGFFGYFGAFTLLFPIIGGLFAFLAVRSNRREIRAYREGRPVMARVTYAGLDHSTRLNNRHPFKISWEFKVNGSASYTGSISSMREEDLHAFATAGEIVVLYDPEDPGINTLYVP
ncbi:MAG TPA: DUF3592 domain-containing protein [Myxococcales bacterium]|jgi:hypothetical protein